MDKDGIIKIFEEVLGNWYLSEANYPFVSDVDLRKLDIEKEEYKKRFLKTLNS